MAASRIGAASLLLLVASCASDPTSFLNAPFHSHEAVRQADGTIAIVVTAKSERLASSSGSFTIGLTDMLEKAAAEECGGAFDLTQDPTPTMEVKNGRLVATLHGIARCK